MGEGKGRGRGGGKEMKIWGGRKKEEGKERGESVK